MNQNVGAIIIASDGIYNQGQHPLYLKQQLPVPIYTIALGDTTPQKDLILRKVHHNKIVYLSNQFSIHIDIQAQNCNKEQTDLLVKKIGRNDEATIVHKKSISIENDYFEDNIPVILEANKAGILHYRIILSPVKQEVTIANNVQDIYIEVLDSKQKILILAGSPHPDIAAIKQAIESNENYEVHARLVSEFKENINEYSLLILHQLPNRQDNINKVLNLSNNVRIPVLYIIGANTSIFAFNNIQNILKIDNKSAKSLNEVQANVDKDFALFSLSEHSINNIEKYPPLLVHFGYYTLSPSAAILAYQRIGTASTKYPLLVFSQTLDSKIGILCGEGFWRWRIYDYVNNKDHNTTNALFSKIVQYLSVKTDKRKFKVMIEKSIFNETEPVTFDAELYNASYELTNEPDVTIIITNEKGKEFPFVFSKTGNAYLLDAGAFSPGSYTYEAKVTFNNKTQTLKGQFSVLPLRLEAMQSTADHQLLYQLSDNSGGQLVYPNELEKIANMLQQMKDIKPMSYTEYKTEALINLKWICFLLLFLLGSEWFIRKWNGSY